MDDGKKALFLTEILGKDVNKLKEEVQNLDWSDADIRTKISNIFDVLGGNVMALSILCWIALSFMDKRQQEDALNAVEAAKMALDITESSDAYKSSAIGILDRLIKSLRSSWDDPNWGK